MINSINELKEYSNEYYLEADKLYPVSGRMLKEALTLMKQTRTGVMDTAKPRKATLMTIQKPKRKSVVEMVVVQQAQDRVVIYDKNTSRKLLSITPNGVIRHKNAIMENPTALVLIAGPNGEIREYVGTQMT